MSQTDDLSEPTESHSDEAFHPDPPLVARMKLQFAMLSTLGGLVLSIGSESASLSVIAVFFSIFGYVCVDWLRLFALPSAAAYALMALAAAYCVSDFMDLDGPPNHQMIAVAQLLAFVQAILMLQKKSRRIYEQLSTFCLLELVVAAVFNNALSYGLLLIPMGIVAVMALSSLAVAYASDGIFPPPEDVTEDGSRLMGLRQRKRRDGFRSRPLLTFDRFESLVRRSPRHALYLIAPAVALLALIFFYALPRTTEAAPSAGGPAVVGFSDSLRLDQIGRMNFNPQIALRIRMQNSRTGAAYRVSDPLYLRGRVLEVYQTEVVANRRVGQWQAITPARWQVGPSLPPVYAPPRSADRNFFDEVRVDVTAEANSSESLFAIGPYYAAGTSGSIVHIRVRETLRHVNAESTYFPRVSYRFVTHGFRGGMALPLRSFLPLGESPTEPGEDDQEDGKYASSVAITSVSSGGDPSLPASAARDVEDYLRRLLVFDREEMPAVYRLMKRFDRRPSGDLRNSYDFARTVELHLATSPDYRYTLQLNADPDSRSDPIDKFLSRDRAGHCQFFASALLMALRARGIPARMVVGYATDEYHELSGRYIARGSHAHAWVEALVPASDLPNGMTVYGQPPSDRYWLRLDPTPGSRRAAISGSAGVNQVFDMAQNMWDDYVVEMDGGRQQDALSVGGAGAMHGSYMRMVQRMSILLGRVRAGELGGGSLAAGGFSVTAAFATFGLALAGIMAVRFRPSRVRRRQRSRDARSAEDAQLGFYREAMAHLRSVGLERGFNQTPQEFTSLASQQLQHPLVEPLSQPLSTLTRWYYRLRFGTGDGEATGSNHPSTKLPSTGSEPINDEIRHALAQLQQRTASLDPKS